MTALRDITSLRPSRLLSESVRRETLRCETTEAIGDTVSAED